MFGIIDLFKKLPLTALILFGGFIPTLFIILTILFIMLHIGIICPVDILDLLFEDNKSGYYQAMYKFIDVGMSFIGGFSDMMFKIIKITFDALLGEGNFLDSFESGQNKCHITKMPLEESKKILDIK